MKARTKIQKEVDAIRHDLPQLTTEQREYLKENLFKDYMYRTKHETTCFSCGRRWNNNPKESILSASILGDICPSCKRSLVLYAGGAKKRVFKEEKHGCIITTHKNYQVFRYFYVKRDSRVKSNSHYTIAEVQQEWIREDGKWVDVAILVNSFNYGQNWAHSSELEIRKHGYNIDVTKYLPKPKFLKVIRRNGYKRTFHSLNPAYFCHMILTNNKAETLLKAKHISIFQKIGSRADDIETYWPSIKIAIRHHYTVTNASDWLDHLDILSYFNKDILNPKLICVEDFRTEHQRLIDKRNKIEAKRRYEEKKKQIAEDDIAFKKAKNKFFKLQFANGDLTIAPLTSVQEFYDEAEAMHHCVSGYYKREDSLLLSAKLQGQRLETIEVSLKEFSVLQSRGLQNDPTDHHEQIKALVEGNMNKIKKAHKSKPTHHEKI